MHSKTLWSWPITAATRRLKVSLGVLHEISGAAIITRPFLAVRPTLAVHSGITSALTRCAFRIHNQMIMTSCRRGGDALMPQGGHVDLGYSTDVVVGTNLRAVID